MSAQDHALPTKQAKSPAAMPLYVDLDGTLIRSDAAQEMLIATLRKPDGIRALLRAAMNRDVTQIKRVSADHALLDAARLPYNAEVVDYLAEARAEGRRVVLATAADAKVAHAVADHLGVFDAVIATEPGANQKGKVKLAAIKRDCGDAPFEYLGDSDADLPIWQAAAGRGFVNPTGKAYDASKQAGDALTVLVQDKPDTRRGLIKAMRPHQWVKNVLVFIPVLFAHAYGDLKTVALACAAFVVFSALTSGTYLINDLFDIEADRQHPRKRNRPFAAGVVTPLTGVKVAVALIGGALLAGFWGIGFGFGMGLLSYLVMTMTYTFVLKSLSTIDVIVLGLLFTVRVVAGGLATGILISPWLLTFSFFFFVSLAYLKRYIELFKMKDAEKLPSRNYWREELSVVQSFGITTAALSLLTLSQYLMHPDVRLTYSGKDLLWLIIPLLMFWTYRIWMWASRGKVHDDPVLFAFKDKISRISLGLMLLLVILARYVSLEPILQ
ncbi:Decaprenyl-phosphate phosphoribosyltransferase [Roseovarius sp. THAF9]|uniref:UbiA family prenyltransferase n=1 Tax=Roseovarius sp. THAF9 TaxID=2587847 RepID=UPI0012AA04C3|nr:UbiA family prenyltransferase [Roseovarius sp. THAF9]QFT94768.1 Decaprenyl-phosphate phosphoribosyltransferase [Roseovarius sp. THAF9]